MNVGGNKALFKGGTATVLRGVAMNASMTGPYDYLRERLWITFGDFGFIDVLPIFYAALWGTVITLPIDNIKTRMQRAFDDPAKNRFNLNFDWFRLTYSCFRDTINQIISVEGFRAPWVGAYPYYLKMVAVCWMTTWVQNRFLNSWK